MKNLCFLIISPSVSRRYQIHSSSVHSALFIIHDLRDPIVSGIYKNFIFSLSTVDLFMRFGLWKHLIISCEESLLNYEIP